MASSAREPDRATAHKPGLLSGVSDRALLFAVLFAAVGSAGLVFWGSRDGLMAAGFAATTMILAALLHVVRTLYPPVGIARLDFDWALVREAADNGDVAVAVTDRVGRLVCANALHESWFGGPTAPPALGLSEADTAALTQAGRVAWRDGRRTHRGKSFASTRWQAGRRTPGLGTCQRDCLGVECLDQRAGRGRAHAEAPGAMRSLTQR